MVVEATRPCLFLPYNDQALPHEDELARRRHLSFTRSTRAAAEALERIRQEAAQHGDKTKAPVED
jgi:hypothetical protein